MNEWEGSMNVWLGTSIGFALFFMISVLWASPPIIIAHRGGAKHKPENTVEAFRCCLDHGVLAIELDVQLTKDLIPVVFHDETIGRLTNKVDNRSIQELTLEDVRQLEVGGWFSPEYHGEPIPTLQEVLQMLPPHVHLMVEVKDHQNNQAQTAKSVAATLNQYGKHLPNLVTGSLEPGLVAAMKKETFICPIIGIVDTKEDLYSFLKLGLDHFAVNQDLIKSGTFHSLAGNQVKKLWSWTVNDPTDLPHLLQMNVEGIITDDPPAIQQALLSHN